MSFHVRPNANDAISSVGTAAVRHCIIVPFRLVFLCLRPSLIHRCRPVIDLHLLRLLVFVGDTVGIAHAGADGCLIDDDDGGGGGGGGGDDDDDEDDDASAANSTNTIART
jgi:hypothetical protein